MEGKKVLHVTATVGPAGPSGDRSPNIEGMAVKRVLEEGRTVKSQEA